MRFIIKILFFLALATFLVNCATRVMGDTVAHKEPVPTKEFVMSNFTEEQLNNGKTLYENNCAKCHDLKDPTSRTPDQWNNVLKSMIPKAKLAYEDGRLVRAYLVAHSK